MTKAKAADYSQMICELALPYPPTVNHYWRHTARGTLISRRGRTYRKAVAEAVFVQSRDLEWKLPMAGRLWLELRVYPPDRRRRDLDNLLKALLDALEHAGFFGDDAQVAEIKISRQYRIPRGKVLVSAGQLW